jgi:hypothetical protein
MVTVNPADISDIGHEDIVRPVTIVNGIAIPTADSADAQWIGYQSGNILVSSGSTGFSNTGMPTGKNLLDKMSLQVYVTLYSGTPGDCTLQFWGRPKDAGINMVGLSTPFLYSSLQLASGRHYGSLDPIVCGVDLTNLDLVGIQWYGGTGTFSFNLRWMFYARCRSGSKQN